DLFSQCLSIDKLHRDEMGFIGDLTLVGALRYGGATADLIDVGDVRMIEGGSGSGFLLKAEHAKLVGRELGRQEFDGNLAVQPRVLCDVDFSHSAFANLRADFVATKFCAWGQAHKCHELSARFVFIALAN